jgi:hypothetical protein
MKEENKNQMNMNSLVSELETKDSKYKKIMRRFQILFFVCIFLYAGLFLINPDPELTVNDRIAGACYVVAFTLFALQFRTLYKRYKHVNYFDPVKKVLEDAERRYRLWQKSTLLVLVSILCIDAATLLILYDRFEGRWTFWQFFTGVQLVFVFIIALGFVIGYIRWRKESRPIWLSAKQLLKELEE